MQAAVPDRSGRWQALYMHIGRAKKLASEQSFSGVTTGAAGGGGGTGATTTGMGALAVSVAVGRRGVSVFTGLDAPVRGRSAGFAGLSAAADAGAIGALVSMTVSIGSLMAAAGTIGVLSNMTSSGCTTAIGATALGFADHLRQPQVAATTVNRAKTPINIQTTAGRSCLPPPRLAERGDGFLLRAVEWFSTAAVCPKGSRKRRLRSEGFSSRAAGVLSGPHWAVAEGDSSESSSGSTNWVGA